MRRLVDWYDIEARCSQRELWAVPRWTGKPPLGPWLLPDGREITDLIADGALDQLGSPIWFEPSQSWQRAGDLLWSGGLSSKLCSQRFADVC